MTGIVYDDVFANHKCFWDENYSESPQRYTSILDRCNSLGLIDRCVKIETRPATEEELLSKHTNDHISLLKNTENYDDEKLEHTASKYDSIYVHPFTYKQSLLAAGSSVELVEAVANGRVQNGMAIIRPPGHHAMKNEYCGYCFFNNVAIATQHLLDTTQIQKILIVDWDVHHGQATQQMFYDDPRVLYFSIHRYEHGQFWPNLRESDFDYIGNGNGIGFNINVPLNSIAMKNEDYMAIVHYLLIPLTTEFSPELVIISSGYDSAIGDPKGEMLVTPACYAHITQKLMGLVNGKVIAILEGGYYLTSLAEGVALTLKALLGDPSPVIESLHKPSKCVMESIRNVVYVHSNYWDCFKYSILKNENSPVINYMFVGEKPEVYQTRNMYLKIDTTNFDKILNTLITETKIFNSQNKLGLIFKMIGCSQANIKESDIYKYLESHIGHLHTLKERRSTIKELNLVYSNNYITEMFCQPNNIDNKDIKEINDDFIDRNSMLNDCCFNVGSLLKIIDSIFENKIKSGISTPASLSIANSNENMYLLNAPIIGANYAIHKYFIKRVLLVELNGNVSQNYSNDQITVISVNRLLSDLKFGKENNSRNYVKISWPKEKLNDAEFTTIMHYLILPVAYEYNPELIIVSTKFCSNFNKTGINITPTIYGNLIHCLSTLANGRLILWNEEAHDSSIFQKECLLECCNALLGKPIKKLNVKNVLSSEIKEIIYLNIKNHCSMWKSMQYL